MALVVHQQAHGYKSGHQLLSASVRLQPDDQEIVDRLSDMAGPLRPNERFAPYLTAYPLPSGIYYVLARTEQDLNAPRAGCVLTRSLLIPSAFWEGEAGPAALVAMLEVGGDATVPIPVSAIDRSPPLPIVSSGALVELVEALFLEKRVPIVMFNMPDAHSLALRLLTSLWPAQRREFSICTFALSPRYIASRPFDLLFAPKSARSRFADWNGRLIDAAGQRAADRHRWSGLIRERIFESPTPYLLDRGALSLLRADEDSSENVLRLSLLWDELREKSATSPTAVLGLLDIANTRNAALHSWPTLRPAIAEALVRAVDQMSPTEAWSFILALFGKTANVSARMDLFDNISSAASFLTKRDADTAFETIARLDDVGESERNVLISAIATNVGGLSADRLVSCLQLLADGQILEFCVKSEACRRAVMGKPSDRAETAPPIIARLGSALTSNPAGAQALLPDLLPLMESVDHAQLLSPLLQKASDVDLLAAIDLIWAKTAAHNGAMASNFCILARLRHIHGLARSRFAAAGSDAATDKAILELSDNEPVDLGWMLEQKMDVDRRSSLVAAWICRLSDPQLDVALSTGGYAAAALNAISASANAPVEVLVRILIRPVMPTKLLLEFGASLYPRISGKARQRLGKQLAYRAVTDPAIQDPGAIGRILGLTVDAHDLPSLINAGITRAADGGHASRVLAAFDGSSPPVRRNVVTRLDALASAVISRGKFDLTAAGAQALANLTDAAKGAAHSHLRVCSQLLPLAMSALTGPASPLVIATFPAVYEELRKDADGFDIWKLFGFTDWDKCKTARKDVVRAFLNSVWPPVDLARVAASTPDPGRILKRLLKEQGGVSYFKRIVGDAGTLAPGVRKAVTHVAKLITKAGAGISESET